MAEGAKKPVRLTIFHQSYTVLAPGDPADLEAAARSVDELMTAIAKSTNVDATRTAVLACLHLADQLRTVERELDAIRQRVSEKSENLARLLDGAMEKEE